MARIAMTIINSISVKPEFRLGMGFPCIVLLTIEIMQEADLNGDSLERVHIREPSLRAWRQRARRVVWPALTALGTLRGLRRLMSRHSGKVGGAGLPKNPGICVAAGL